MSRRTMTYGVPAAQYDAAPVWMQEQLRDRWLDHGDCDPASEEDDWDWDDG